MSEDPTKWVISVSRDELDLGVISADTFDGLVGALIQRAAELGEATTGRALGDHAPPVNRLAAFTDAELGEIGRALFEVKPLTKLAEEVDAELERRRAT